MTVAGAGDGGSPFDAVSVERLRRRRTVKWTLYGPDVLAAWVAEMDVDLASVVKAAHGNRRRLAELVEAQLPGVRLHVPEGTFLAWLDCAALGVDDPARFFLDEARVALSDGPPYGGPAGGYDQHVRLNFATSTALLERIVGAMGAAVRRR